MTDTSSIPTFQVDGRRIGAGEECYVIAEIGSNHQGDVETAKRLFDAAVESGADAVKLQKRDNGSLFTQSMLDMPYENRNSFGVNYGEHRRRLEFDRDQHLELIDYAKAIGTTLFSTAFDHASADFLAELDMPAFKIASADLCNLPLIDHCSSFGKPMFISTGGGTVAAIDRALDTVARHHDQVCVLQCTAAYPAPAEEMNLRVIESLIESYPTAVVGLSDHYNGIVMAVVAYVLGAQVVEKHFTLNHTWKGSDHAMSLEPVGMRKMVRDLRRVRVALGSRDKKPLQSEESALRKLGKQLVAARDLAPGDRIAEGDVVAKSPAGGMTPDQVSVLIGSVLRKGLLKDEAISLDHVESQ